MILLLLQVAAATQGVPAQTLNGSQPLEIFNSVCTQGAGRLQANTTVQLAQLPKRIKYNETPELPISNILQINGGRKPVYLIISEVGNAGDPEHVRRCRVITEGINFDDASSILDGEPRQARPPGESGLSKEWSRDGAVIRVTRLPNKFVSVESEIAGPIETKAREAHLQAMIACAKQPREDCKAGQLRNSTPLITERRR